MLYFILGIIVGLLINPVKHKLSLPNYDAEDMEYSNKPLTQAQDTPLIVKRKNVEQLIEEVTQHDN